MSIMVMILVQKWMSFRICYGDDDPYEGFLKRSGTTTAYICLLVVTCHFKFRGNMGAYSIQ